MEKDTHIKSARKSWRERTADGGYGGIKGRGGDVRRCYVHEWQQMVNGREAEVFEKDLFCRYW